MKQAIVLFLFIVAALTVALVSPLLGLGVFGLWLVLRWIAGRRARRRAGPVASASRGDLAGRERGADGVSNPLIAANTGALIGAAPPDGPARDDGDAKTTGFWSWFEPSPGASGDGGSGPDATGDGGGDGGGGGGGD